MNMLIATGLSLFLGLLNRQSKEIHVYILILIYVYMYTYIYIYVYISHIFSYFCIFSSACILS